MRDAAGPPRWDSATGLTGRRAECDVLGRLIAAVRAGESRALLLHGDPGVGKTALLDHLAAQARNCRVVRAAGVESERELAFAGLHQLCAPMLDRLEHLPVPQRDALGTAFGLSTGPAPDRFLVGLAVLGLLSEVAEQQPLICLVDDRQWLDRASAQILAFVARRLGAESIGLILASRGDRGDLTGVPELLVQGLPEPDARALLDTVPTGPIDTRVRDQIVLEARGNPLALLELTRGWAPAELAGGFGLPGAAAPSGDMAALSGDMEENFLRRVAALPRNARQLLLVAAADPSGDPALVWRTAGRLGIGGEAAVPVTEAGLAEFGGRVRFRHPLARSAAYRSASVQDRQEAHRALAAATDRTLDPDRRAWHRAQASPGPDEDVAAELERSAGRARARGGTAASAAFLHQAAVLTLDPARRAGRALDAARAALRTGALDVTRELLAMAGAGPLTAVQRAGLDTMRAQLAFSTARGGEAPTLLLKAAGQLEAVDADLSRAAYLDAVSAAIFAGRLAGPGGDVLDAARAAVSAPPPPHAPHACDFLLDGTAAGLHTGYAAGVPVLREALAAFWSGLSAEEQLRWMWPANITAIRIWDDDQWAALSARYVRLARDAGAFGELPLALTSRAHVLLFAGELASAAALTEELQAVKEATGSGLAPYGAMALAALRGEESAATAVIEATLEDAARRGEGIGITFAEGARAVLNNALGRYDVAMSAGLRANAYDHDPAGLCWTLAELAEAAARCGAAGPAADACDRLGVMAGAAGTDWVRGVEARARALLSEGEAAERLYREAIARLGRTRMRVELARAHLLYGEWLRRERHPGLAREQLRTAHGMLERMGATAFADRAARELRAAGGTAHRRTAPARDEELTAQEAQIARMARDGLSNPEIGTRLFISARTVQYHLRKVFTKLGITSRSQLDRVLPRGPAG
ncbi:AAA family ATPase [Streptomyces sp. NPDC050788]|uniref:helix-turn-helix transcriptional regulator n=1 Tax=Streptomyces sp. NPDC050788 TaxID=3155041 RepID=UPI00342BDEA7